MPVGGEPDFQSCVDKMKETEGYSDETAHKVCGKLEQDAKKGMLSPDQATIAEGTTVAKAPHDIEWGFDIQGILASTRKIRGTFHVPKVDKDNEFITEEAMDKAMHDYMHLPVISEYHKERPIGLVTKSWKTKDGEYHFEGVMKDTSDCDDVWQKVQKGEYDMLSIAGKRTDISSECSTHPLLRSKDRPCVTKGLRLDSISACDEGARNDETHLEPVTKAQEDTGPYLYTTKLALEQVNFIKATNAESSLIHVVSDGTRKKDGNMADCSKGQSGMPLTKGEKGNDKEKLGDDKKLEEKEEAYEGKKNAEEKKEEKEWDDKPAGEGADKTTEKKAEPAEEKHEATETGEILKDIHAMMKELHLHIMASGEGKEYKKGEETKLAPPMKKSLKDGKPGQESEEEVGEQREIDKKGEGNVKKAQSLELELKKALDRITTLESQEFQKGSPVIYRDVPQEDSGTRIVSNAAAILKQGGKKK